MDAPHEQLAPEERRAVGQSSPACRRRSSPSTWFSEEWQTNESNDITRRNGSGVGALVSSNVSTGWWAPSVEQLLTRLPNEDPEGGAPADPFPIRSGAVHRQTLAAVGRVATARTRSGLRARLVSVDVAAVAATWLVVGSFATPETVAVRRWAAVAAAALLTLGVMKLLGLYRSRLCVQRGQEAARISVAVLAAAAVFASVGGGGRGGDEVAILAAGSCLLALIIFRWIFGQWLWAQRAQGRFHRGIVLVGTSDDAVDVWTMLRSQPELGYEVRGIIGEPRHHPDWVTLPKGRSVERIPEIARLTEASGVMVVANALSAAEVRRVIGLCETHGLHVQVCPGFRGLAPRRIRHVPMSGEAFLYVEPGRRPTWQLRAKRAMDVFGAVIGGLFALPILLVAFVAIRLEDGGPVVYRQARIGSDGKAFVVYKLRSMAHEGKEPGGDLTVLNERTDGPLFKSSSDPRVTRVGALIRALSIDELPQLFNVLTGTMSLVGPRPALPHEVAQFDEELLRRHTVKPGITGLWQLEARDNPSFHAYRRLDLLYVDNWSIGLDAAILVATVPMVMARATMLRRSEPRGGQEVFSGAQ